jgi:hypothetical protein
MINFLQQTVEAIGGKRIDNLNLWDVSGDCPVLEHFRFEVILPPGTLIIHAYVQKEGTKWPEYECAGDLFKDKFAASLRGDKTVPITDGFIDLTKNNVETYVGQFKQGERHD